MKNRDKEQKKMSEKARNTNTHTPLTNDKKKPTKSETLIEKQKSSRGIVIIVIIPKQSIMRPKKISNYKTKKTNKHCICVILII